MHTHAYDYLNTPPGKGKPMLNERPAGFNDISEVVEADRAHVWHHLQRGKRDGCLSPMVI